jgi:hypothetical protein
MLRVLPFAFLLLAGCAKPEPATYPVEGTAEIGGKPTEGFTVEFSSQAPETKGISATGVVDAQGKFTLVTMIEGKAKPGAVAGPHKVVVIPPPSGTGPAVIAVVPVKYSDYNTTPLTFEVAPAGPNTFAIPLKK